MKKEEIIPDSIPETIPESAGESFSETIVVKITQENVVETVPENVIETVQENVVETVVETVPENVVEKVKVMILETTQETTAEGKVGSTVFLNLLFIDQNVSDYTLFLNNVNDVTLPIVYHSSTTREEILSQLVDFSHFDRIAFVFHGILPGYYYDKPFIENQPYFTLDGSGNVAVTENVTFIQTILSTYTVSHVDFLGCNLLLSKEWRDYFDLLGGFGGIVIGASNDNTGNLKYGGDWILENTMEDVKNVYFTTGLDSYSGLLIELIYNLNRYFHTFYTYSASNPTVLTRSIYDNNQVLQSSFDISFGGQNVQTVLSLLDSGSGPYTLGLVDTNGNSVAMDVAFCGLYSKALNTTQAQKLMTYVNTTFKEPHTSATVYTVTVSGGVFNLNGVARPNITFTSGLYVFDQSSSTNFGNQLVLGTTVDLISSIVDNNVVYSGTAGTLNAYTLIDFSGSNPASLNLYYFSRTATGKGSRHTLTSSASTVSAGSSFTITIDSLYATSYTIEGVTSAELSNALLNGTFSGSFSITYVTLSSIETQKTVTFRVGTLSTTITITVPEVKYVVGAVSRNMTNLSGGYENLVTTNTDTLFYSYDGTNWTGAGSVINGSCLTVAYGNNVWVAGGIGTVYDMAYSTNGKTWTGLRYETKSFFSETSFYYDGKDYGHIFNLLSTGMKGVISVRYLGGYFIAIGYPTDGVGIYFSQNGIDWTKKTIGSLSVFTVTYNGSYWFLISDSVTFRSNRNDSVDPLMTWTNIGPGNGGLGECLKGSATYQMSLMVGTLNDINTGTNKSAGQTNAPWRRNVNNFETNGFNWANWTGFGGYGNTVVGITPYGVNYKTSGATPYITPTTTNLGTVALHVYNGNTYVGKFSLFLPNSTKIYNVHNISFDTILDKWIFVGDQGVMFKNTNNFTTSTDDCAVTLLATPNNAYLWGLGCRQIGQRNY